MLSHLACLIRFHEVPIVLIVTELLGNRVIHKVAEAVSSSLRQQLEVVVGSLFTSEWLW